MGGGSHRLLVFDNRHVAGTEFHLGIPEFLQFCPTALQQECLDVGTKDLTGVCLNQLTARNRALHAQDANSSNFQITSVA
jgi:hypothetical protein